MSSKARRRNKRKAFQTVAQKKVVLDEKLPSNDLDGGDHLSVPPRRADSNERFQIRLQDPSDSYFESPRATQSNRTGGHDAWPEFSVPTGVHDTATHIEPVTAESAVSEKQLVEDLFCDTIAVPTLKKQDAIDIGDEDCMMMTVEKAAPQDQCYKGKTLDELKVLLHKKRENLRQEVDSVNGASNVTLDDLEKGNVVVRCFSPMVGQQQIEELALLTHQLSVKGYECKTWLDSTVDAFSSEMIVENKVDDCGCETTTLRRRNESLETKALDLSQNTSSDDEVERASAIAPGTRFEKRGKENQLEESNYPSCVPQELLLKLKTFKAMLAEQARNPDAGTPAANYLAETLIGYADAFDDIDKSVQVFVSETMPGVAAIEGLAKKPEAICDREKTITPENSVDSELDDNQQNNLDSDEKGPTPPAITEINEYVVEKNFAQGNWIATGTGEFASEEKCYESQDNTYEYCPNASYSGYESSTPDDERP